MQDKIERDWFKPSKHEVIHYIFLYFFNIFLYFHIFFVIRNHRRDSKFPHNLWNVFERVAAGLPRTNNNIEGWHRRMSVSVGCHHPNIWQAMNRLLRHQIIAGEASPLQRPQYRDLNQRLQMLVANYHNRPRLEYLRGIAHNLNM